LGDAVKDASHTRTPVKTKIKESKLLKDLERKQATYGTINKSDVQSIETQPSTFEHMREKAKDLYRRISGQKKGEYTQLTITDDIHDDFSKTLKESKQAGQTKGTYAITEPEIDIEKELEKMNKKSTPQGWAAMKQFKQTNEQNIRKSIARTDAEERKRDRVYVERVQGGPKLGRKLNIKLETAAGTETWRSTFSWREAMTSASSEKFRCTCATFGVSRTTCSSSTRSSAPRPSTQSRVVKERSP
jgi:hypothetical protein